MVLMFKNLWYTAKELNELESNIDLHSILCQRRKVLMRSVF
jgi:hypothetical protein